MNAFQQLLLQKQSTFYKDNIWVTSLFLNSCVLKVFVQVSLEMFCQREWWHGGSCKLICFILIHRSCLYFLDQWHTSQILDGNRFSMGKASWLWTWGIRVCIHGVFLIIAQTLKFRDKKYAAGRNRKCGEPGRRHGLRTPTHQACVSSWAQQPAQMCSFTNLMSGQWK